MRKEIEKYGRNEWKEVACWKQKKRSEQEQFIWIKGQESKGGRNGKKWNVRRVRKRTNWNAGRDGDVLIWSGGMGNMGEDNGKTWYGERKRKGVKRMDTKRITQRTVIISKSEREAHQYMRGKKY